MSASDKLAGAMDKPQGEVAAERKAHILAARVRELKRINRALLAELDVAEERFDHALGVREPVSVVSYKPLKRPKGGKPLSICGAIASDWHFGERVDLGQTNGLNEYSPTIAHTRSDTFFDRIAWLLKLHRNETQIDTFVLALLGDMMTGFIHEDLRQTNYLGPMEEIRELKKALIRGIDFLLTQDIKRLVVPCVWGNHGRINYDREMIGASMRNSYEAGLYWDLRDYYADDPRVEITVAEGPLLYTNIEGYMIRHTHGNSFGFQGGIGGLTIPLIKACFRWDKGIPAHLTCMGHWHSLLDIGHAIINGTLKGYDAFSAKKTFEPEPSQQAFFQFDPKVGRRTGAAPIFVEPPEQWLKRREAALK